MKLKQFIKKAGIWLIVLCTVFYVFTGTVPKVKSANGQLNSNVPETDGEVKDILVDSDSNTTYVAGNFLRLNQPTTGSFVPINKDTGIVSGNYPQVNGTVYTSVYDGVDTIYIGGQFSTVGGVTRNNLAAFNAITGEVTDFNPNVNGAIRVLIFHGITLYVGGSFETVGGQTRNSLASFDITTDELTSFTANISGFTNQNSGGTVRTMVLDGTTLYIGGQFGAVNGVARNGVAGINVSTNALTSFNPNIVNNSGDRNIYTMVLNGSTLYVGGAFDMVDATARNNLAEITLSTGLATSFNPNVDYCCGAKVVFSMVLNGTTLYIGGSFGTAGGQTRNDLAGISTVTGLATSFNPSFSPNYLTVNSLLISGTSLYVGGAFTNINGIIKNNLAVFDLTTGNLTDFDAGVGVAYIYSMLLVDSTLYIGGSFTKVGGINKKNLFAFNNVTNELVNSLPGTNGVVDTMVKSGNILYIGGKFTTVGGQTRNNLAAIDTLTGAVTSFNPDITGVSWYGVGKLLLDGTTLYVGGDFSVVGGQTRNKLAAINTVTGDVTNFNPNINGMINAMVLDGTTLYVGGDFSVVGGQTRNKLAGINTLTGSVTSFNPNVNDNIYSIISSGTTLYVGGSFTTVGGQVRKNLAGFDLTNEQLLPLSLNFQGSGPPANIKSLLYNNGLLYIGGSFLLNFGPTANNFIIYNTINEQVQNIGIANNPVSYFNEMNFSESTLYISGGYSANGVTKNNLYSLTFPTLSISPTYTVSESSVTTPTSIAVTLDQTSETDVTFSFTTSGTAVLNTDYTLNNTTYTIPAGQTSVNVLFTPINNYLDQPNKIANLVLTSSDVFVSSTLATSTITIADDDVSSTTLTDNSMIVHQNQTTGIYKVVLNSQPTANVIISPEVPTGFTISPAFLTFTSGNWNTPQNLTVTLTDPASTNFQTSHITHSITSNDSNYSSHVPVNTAITLISLGTSGGGGSAVSGLSGGGSSSSNSITPVTPATPSTPTTPVTTPVVIVQPIVNQQLNNILTESQFISSITQQDELTIPVSVQTIINRILINYPDISKSTKAQVTTFITQGTNTTKSLGTGERAGVVSSFISAYNKLPSTQTDWQDVIKLANGRWPEQRNQSSEDKAKDNFTTIYKRQPSPTNPNDNNAITIMAYGLRPTNRNLNSEKNAINTFKSLNNRLPQIASDWDTIRAIAYSGARR